MSKVTSRSRLELVVKAVFGREIVTVAQTMMKIRRAANMTRTVDGVISAGTNVGITALPEGVTGGGSDVGTNVGTTLPEGVTGGGSDDTLEGGDV
jgi:hypothetical protein